MRRTVQKTVLLDSPLPKERGGEIVSQAKPIRFRHWVFGFLLLNMNSPSLTSQHMPHVDALRALAVISVFIYHISPSALSGGFSGVDIFFVISGFIVSASVAQKKSSDFKDFFVGFYARRLLRVMPALLVMLLITGLVSALLIPQAWLSDTHRLTESYAFFGLSNFILLKTANDYFSPTAEFNPYTHTWSLGVEEQFYFAFPFLFLFFALSARRKWISAALFIAGMVCSLFLAVSWMDGQKTAAYYSIFSRFWQLASGVLLFMFINSNWFANKKYGIRREWFWLLGWVGLIFLLVGCFTASPALFPWPGAVWTTVGALLFLGGWIHLKKESLTYAWVASPLVQYLGRISYSLYLWHWPVFVIFRWTVGLSGLLSMAAAGLLSVVMALLSFHFIEKPARRLAHHWKRPQYWLVLIALVVVVGCWGLSLGINFIKPRISLHPTAHHGIDWYPYGEDVRADVPGCRVKIKTFNVPGSTVTEFVGEGAGCKKELQQNQIKTIHAIGDSHNLGYAALYKATVLLAGYRVLSYGNGGCPMVSLQPWRESSAHCVSSQKNTIDSVVSDIRPGDIVFLPSLRLPRFADQWVRFKDADVEHRIFSENSVNGRAQSVKDAENLLGNFIAHNAIVIFEAPKPIFKSPTYRCAAAYQRSNPICADGDNVDRAEQLRLREPVVQALASLAKEMPQHVSVWDPFGVLCPSGSECSSYRNGRPMFFDADHISAYGSSLVAPSFVEHLQSQIPQPSWPAPSAPRQADGNAEK